MSSISRSGFTLVEVVIAAFIFAVGALALEATAASSLRRMRRSAQLTLAAGIARSRLESLAGTRCADLRGGSDTVRSIASTWIVEPVAARALRSVIQSVSYQLDGAARRDSYRSLVPCTE